MRRIKGVATDQRCTSVNSYQVISAFGGQRILADRCCHERHRLFRLLLMKIPKAHPDSLADRFREIVSDPCNRLIRRVPLAGHVCQVNSWPERFVVMHNGILVPHGGYYGRFSDVLVINRGVHEPQEEVVFEYVLPEIPDGEPMAELGAYWAFYSAWFKKRKPRSAVYCVEPNAQHLAVGQKTFAANGLEGTFIHGEVGPGRISLEGLMAQQKLRNMGLLHVDIQGAEGAFLADSRDVFSRRGVRFAFISTHSQCIHEKCREFFSSVGYRIIADVDHASDTYACDGLIVACDPKVMINPVALWSRASGAANENV